MNRRIYSKEMAFKCDCCGDYMSSHLLLPMIKRICRICEKAMNQLKDLKTITEREARIRQITKEQVLFFEVDWEDEKIVLPQTKEDEVLLNERAERDMEDLFG